MRGKALQKAIQTGLLPTPMATDIHHGNRVKKMKEDGKTSLRQREKGEAGANGLMDYLDFHNMLPTPTTTDYKGTYSPETMRRKDGKLRTDMLKSLPTILGYQSQQTGGKTSQLNPQFLAEMMSFPPDWTELPFLNGDRNP